MRPHRLALTLLFGLALAAACGGGSSNNNSGGTPGGVTLLPSADYEGVFMGPNVSGSISLTFDLPVGAPQALSLAPTGPAVAAASVPTNVTGTMVFAAGGLSPIDLAGSASGNQLSVSGGGFTFTGTIQSGTMHGSYSGPESGSFEFFSSTPTVPSVSACGSYAGTLAVGGTDGGLLTSVTAGSSWIGFSFSNAGFLVGPYTGSISGTTFSADYDFTTGTPSVTYHVQVSGTVDQQYNSTGTYSTTFKSSGQLFASGTVQSSPCATGPSGSSASWLGVVTGGDAVEAGSIIFTAQTTNPAPPGPGGVRAASAPVNAAAVLTIESPSAATVNLAGSYDPSNHRIDVTGSGYAFTGTYDGSLRMEGNYTGPNGPGTFVSAIASNGGLSAYCGTFVTTDQSDHGLWSFVVAQGTLLGTAVSAVNANVVPLDGTVSGSSVTVFFPGTQNTFATGTISPSVGGTFDDGQGTTGTWTGISCQ